MVGFGSLVGLAVCGDLVGRSDFAKAGAFVGLSVLGALVGLAIVGRLDFVGEYVVELSTMGFGVSGNIKLDCCENIKPSTITLSAAIIIC